MMGTTLRSTLLAKPLTISVCHVLLQELLCMTQKLRSQNRRWVYSSECGWHTCLSTSARCAHMHAPRHMQAQSKLRQFIIPHRERMLVVIRSLH